MSALETNRKLYEKAASILKSWGWGTAIDFHPGWSSRTNSSTIMTPQAVTVHHTGGRATATSYLVNPVDRPQLKVLANIHISHNHRIKFIAAGGASHGGYTHEPCYQRVVQGTAPLDRDLDPGADSRTFSINKRTVGIEVDGAGGAKEWDDWTYRAVVATCAALQIAGGWPVKGSPRVGAHKEHTKRKPGDPYAPMGKLRRDVLDCLKSPWGPDGPADEPTPIPNPKPEVTAVRKFRLLQQNTKLGRWSGTPDTSPKWPAWLRKQKPSIMLLAETTEARRDAIKAAFPGWLSWSAGTTVVMWAPSWRHDRATLDSYEYGTACHALARVTLTDPASGLSMDVISVHLRPGAAFPDSWSDSKIAEAKRDDLAAGLAKLLRPGVATWVGGDFNTSTHYKVMQPLGFTPATPYVDTMPKTGSQKLDRVWFRSGTSVALAVRGRTKLRPGKLTDHTGWLVNATMLTAPSPL